MCIQIGLLGKTNVGKSTFFSAATEIPVKIGNFPYTTIKPNIGTAYVTTRCACEYFEIEHKNIFCINGTRLIPIKLIDVAGLIPGASIGKGLGNKFLDDASHAKILIHVVDISGSTDLYGQFLFAGAHDPLEDIKFVENEFEQWFKQILKREWKNLTKATKNNNINLVDSIAYRFSGLSIKKSEIYEVLKQLSLLSKKPSDWNDYDIELFSNELRKKTKPIIIAANKADICSDLKIINKIKNNLDITICSAEYELVLRKATKAGLIDYFSGNKCFKIFYNKTSKQQLDILLKIKKTLSKINSTGIQSALNTAVFDILNFMVVYPVEDENNISNKSGVVLPDAKLVPSNATIKDIAYGIHKDIHKGFLYGINVKTKKRVGDNYKLRNGDVIKIVSSLSKK